LLKRDKRGARRNVPPRRQPRRRPLRRPIGSGKPTNSFFVRG
jgi:hypothetical protein